MKLNPGYYAKYDIYSTIIGEMSKKSHLTNARFIKTTTLGLMQLTVI